MSEFSVVMTPRPNPESNPVGAAGYDTSNNRMTFIIDPKKFDLEKIAELTKAFTNSEGEEKQKALKALTDHLAEEVRKQIDSALPGASANISKDMLIQIGMDSIKHGALSQRVDYTAQPQVCVIGVGGVEVQSAHDYFSDFARVKQDRLKPLPGPPEVWLQYIGDHEGAHCNRNNEGYGKDPLKTLQAELYADEVALKKLRERGHSEIANAIIDLRIIGALDALMTITSDKIPVSHATGFFLGQDGSTRQPTEQDLKNLENMKDIFLDVVQRKLGALENAQELYKNDPDKFHKLLEEARKEGLLASRVMNVDEAKDAICKEMGVTRAEYERKFKDMDVEFINKFEETALRMHSENKFTVPDANVQRFAEMYMDAYNRRIQEAPAPRQAAEVKADVKTSEAPAIEAEKPSIKSASFAHSEPGRYDYLLAELPEMVKNKGGISVDPDSFQINVGGRRLAEAFAVKSDPFLFQHEQLIREQHAALSTQFMGVSAPEFKVKSASVSV